MRLHNRLRKPAVLLCCALLLQIFASPMFAAASVLADNLADTAQLSGKAAAAYTVDKANTDGTFTNCDGFASFNDAKADMLSRSAKEKKLLDSKSYVVRYSGRVIAMTGGMAAVLSASNTTLSFDNTYGGNRPYVVGRTTMYYYDTEAPDKVWIGVSGIKARTKYQNLLLIPAPFMAEYATETFKKTNTYQIDYFYRNSVGDVMHTVTSLSDANTSTQYESGEKTTAGTFTMDKAPEFMQADRKYYSMDGINYYADPLLTEDVGTFYPYFQYLSYHTESEYTAAQLNSYMKENFKSDSVLLNQGKALIQAQKDFGINALMELAYASHETGGGITSIAKNKNNVFGIQAYDSSPGESASTFASVEECILYHAERYLKRGYLDALTDSRYYGSNPGSKTTGINVRYASDPYHGQKVAGWAYRMDKTMGSKDYGKYSIGITGNSVPVYADAGCTTVLYYMRNNKNNADLSGLPVVVLSKVSSNVYKVQSDMPIKDDGTAYYLAAYSFEHVGYIRAGDLTVLDTAIIPAKPSDVTATAASATSVELSWKESFNAQGYEVQILNAQTSEYETVTAAAKETTVTVKKLTGGTEYTFRVRAYRTAGGEKIYSSYTSAVTGITKPVKLTNLSVQAAGLRSLTLSWPKVNGADGYLVRRSLTLSGGYVSIATISSGDVLTYKDTNLDPDTTYYYSVRAFKNYNGKTVSGTYADSVSAVPKSVAPTGIKAVSAGNGSSLISWKKIAGVSGYMIYRQNPSTSKYENIGKTTKSTAVSFTDQGLKIGAQYQYKVCAYIVLNGKTTVSAYSDIASIAIAPGVPDGFAAVSSGFKAITLTWNPTPSAVGYSIERALSEDGEYEIIAAINKQKTKTYTDKNLDMNTTYYYRIRAFSMINDTALYGEYSTVVSALPKDVKLTIITATASGANTIQVSWKKVSSATGYEIYRRNPETLKYESLGRISYTQNSYTDKGLARGVKYYYKVRPYKKISGVRIYGKYSGAVSAKP